MPDAESNQRNEYVVDSICDKQRPVDVRDRSLHQSWEQSNKFIPQPREHLVPRIGGYEVLEGILLRVICGACNEQALELCHCAWPRPTVASRQHRVGQVTDRRPSVACTWSRPGRNEECPQLIRVPPG